MTSILWNRKHEKTELSCIHYLHSDLCQGTKCQRFNEELLGFSILIRAHGQRESFSGVVQELNNSLHQRSSCSSKAVSMKGETVSLWVPISPLYSLVIAISGILAAKIQVTAQNLKACRLQPCLACQVGHSIGVIHCKFLPKPSLHFQGWGGGGGGGGGGVLIARSISGYWIFLSYGDQDATTITHQRKLRPHLRFPSKPVPSSATVDFI
ncbi:hypothetical protein NC653_007787 [Populus alba x Populus x berolinensis]|uniref:Uncharacterized protein n=1 Tax=Populus alba x Populus x berolinensis TaxID=444605 RepID=A0AAD6W988_9ROSI|nr:hypothetical protein NC653_007787 [Populus alba x Populus x berolinensis]